jgi:hypothetical protein
MKRIYSLIIGACLIVSCSKSSIEQEQDLCKDAKSVPQIAFLKLTNTFLQTVDVLGIPSKIDSISITFKWQDVEADLGTDIIKKILNSDGSRESILIDLLKKNADGTFSKLLLSESLNIATYPFLTEGKQILGGGSLPYYITTLSSCNGELSFSMRFTLSVLGNIGLKINDKIKFQIYVKDRASHLSNIIETTETTLSENP